MLAQLRSATRRLSIALLLVAAAAGFASCASEKQDVALVNDPDAKKESMIPWNKQEKWESQGPMGNITDRR